MGMQRLDKEKEEKQLYQRLEPLAPKCKTRWCKEIEWLLSITHHIVEFVPSYHSSLDGTLVEIIMTKPRSDLQMSIPALCKLDDMLLVLAEMEIPDVYWNSLPKNGRASFGGMICHHITSEQFSPESLLSSLDLSSEHSILDVKNRMETSIAIWK
eukprot:Gb_05352 [translate_table: standard]